MPSIRQWHSYIGLFTGPSVLFFALTGAVQLYGLHEAHGHYVPPAAIEKLSSVHKDQVFALSDHHEPSAPETDSRSAGAPAPDKDADDKPSLATLILKGFFLLVALSLSVSTALGIWMGLTQTRRTSLAWVLLIAGALIPAALVLA